MPASSPTVETDGSGSEAKGIHQGTGVLTAEESLPNGQGLWMTSQTARDALALAYTSPSRTGGADRRLQVTNSAHCHSDVSPHFPPADFRDIGRKASVSIRREAGPACLRMSPELSPRLTNVLSPRRCLNLGARVRSVQAPMTQRRMSGSPVWIRDQPIRIRCAVSTSDRKPSATMFRYSDVC